jgi:MFS family permease
LHQSALYGSKITGEKSRIVHLMGFLIRSLRGSRLQGAESEWQRFVPVLHLVITRSYIYDIVEKWNMVQAPQKSAERERTEKPILLGLVAIFLIYTTSYYYAQTLGVARPKMAAELNGMPLYAWLISIPGLAGAFATLLFLKFSDMYGRRLMIMVSLTIFMVGTILSAVSPTFSILIAANAMARLGSGALAPLCLSVLGDIFPPAERSRWVGLLNIPAGALALVGPTLGGWFVDNLSWRHIYWMGLPLIVLCLIAVPTGMPSVGSSAIRKIDVRGSALMMVASTATILAFSFAGTIYPWASPQVLGLLFIGLLFGLLFYRVETVAEEPLLDPQVLQNRTFLLVVLSGILSIFGLTAMMVYFPLFLQGVQGMSAMRSGQILTPFGVLMAFVGVPTGFLIARTKRYKRMFVMSYALLLIVLSGCMFFSEKTPMVWGLAAATLGGLGLGAVPTLKTVVVQCVVPKRLLAIATGAYFFSVAMAMSISPAVLGSVMNIAYAEKLKTSLPAELNGKVDDATMSSLGNSRVLLSKQAMQALERTFSKTDGDGSARFRQTVQAIRSSMEFGLRMVFLVGAGTMFLAFLLVLFIPEASIDIEVKDKRAP